MMASERRIETRINSAEQDLKFGSKNIRHCLLCRGEQVLFCGLQVWHLFNSISTIT